VMRDAGKPVDIICLTETWARSCCSIDPPNGYEIHDLPRPGKRDGGRVGGGLAILVREGAFRLIEVAHKSSDGARLWVRLGGLPEEKDFYLGLCYLPPVGSEFFRTFRLTAESFLQELTEEVANFTHRGDVMITGDFNARVGEERDFMSLEAGDIIEGVTDENWSGATTRVSQDKVVNARGRRFLEFCMTTGLGIINGRAMGDSLGAFTCGTSNGNSVVDYMLVDFSLWERVEEMLIMAAGFESDHRPMLATVGKSAIEDSDAGSPGGDERGLVLDEQRWDEYKAAVQRRAETLREVEEGRYGAVEGAQLLHQVVLESAQAVFARRSTSAKGNFPANGWFDEECKQAKRTLRELIRGGGPSSNLVKEMEKRYITLSEGRKGDGVRGGQPAW
jgi:Endonuclease/Exonuclease/phosphatase family